MTWWSGRRPRCASSSSRCVCGPRAVATCASSRLRCATTPALRPRSGSTRASWRVRSCRGRCSSCAPRCGRDAGSSWPCASTRCWPRRARDCTRAEWWPSTTPRARSPRRVLRELVEQHLPRTDAIADPLPVGVRIGRRLPLRRDAIAALHAPRSPEDAKIASDRLAYEELLLLQIALAERRAGGPAADSLGRPGELLRRYHAVAPVHAHDGPEAQRARRRPRSRARRPPDAPPAPRGRRLGQDRGRGARDAACRRTRRPGCAAGAHGGAGAAARRHSEGPGGAARSRARRDHGRPAGGRAACAPAAHRLGRRLARRRHARAARVERRVRRACA